MDDADDERGPVRLDKWLWAARFFRTRSIAKSEVEAGHVRYESERAKVSRVVQIGATLHVRQGYEEREIVVLALSDQRRGAPEAQTLYEETAASRERRAQAKLLREAASQSVNPTKPSKKQRRMLDRFKKDHGWS
ncbi:MAG: RNA-binding S4 domain-containing protein [Panacagrimonas sp.]